jgi:hypothetical protein
MKEKRVADRLFGMRTMKFLICLYPDMGSCLGMQRKLGTRVTSDVPDRRNFAGCPSLRLSQKRSGPLEKLLRPRIYSSTSRAFRYRVSRIQPIIRGTCSMVVSGVPVFRVGFRNGPEKIP